MVTKTAAKTAVPAAAIAKKAPARRKVAAKKVPPTKAVPPAAAPAPPDAAASAEAANAVRLSAQQVWQAGLAAFAKAQEEGGRVFSKLVQEGHALQQRKQETGVASGAAAADDGGPQTAGAWDKLEHVFEERVTRALAKIGVPSQKEIDALKGRIDELSRELALLKAATPAIKPARQPAVKKTATK